MRILLTGGTGLLGGRLLPLLKGHDVVCLTRQAGNSNPASSVRYLIGDLGQPDAWREEVGRFAPHWCIHLAWQGLPDYSLSQCRVNLDASLRLIEGLVAAKVERIVVAGSCWEYGEARGAVAENLKGVGCGVFAATKLALLSVLESVAQTTPLKYRWARLFFCYGPGQRAQSLIPHCHAAFAADRLPEIRSPNSAHDFVHVDDVARALLAIAEHEGQSGVFNVGTGKPTTVGGLANRVAAHFGRPALFSSPTPDTGFWADTTRTAKVTGWRSEISLQDGLDQTLADLDTLR